MRIFTLIVALLSLSTILLGQNIIGAWESIQTSETGVKERSVVIFADGYQVIAVYDADSGAFIRTNGGTWKLEGDMMTEKIEFDTKTPERVGSEVSFKVDISDNEIGIVGSTTKLTRVDNGQPGKLQGAWLMSGRVRDGKTQNRDTTRPRKTMKILSGTRFQWIAYDTESKEFKGSGGGTYTTVDGVYTENIEFFSRDNSRVGASLNFDFELQEGAWHHSGLSSKGSPIHEIWSVRE